MGVCLPTYNVLTTDVLLRSYTGLHKPSFLKLFQLYVCHCLGFKASFYGLDAIPE